MTKTTPPTAASRPKSPPKAPTTRPGNSPVRPSAGDADRLVTLAVVIGAHGVTGEVRLKVFSEDLGAYTSFNGGTLTLRSVRTGSNGAIARFAEVADRNAAEALRGTELAVPRASLPPLGDGEYYHVDLIGLPVVTDGGEAVGTVTSVDNFGAGDILDVTRPDGRSFMVPVALAEIGEQAVIPADFSA